MQRTAPTRGDPLMAPRALKEGPPWALKGMDPKGHYSAWPRQPAGKGPGSGSLGPGPFRAWGGPFRIWAQALKGARAQALNGPMGQGPGL